MVLNDLVYWFNFIVSNIIISFCLIYDLKYRRIPNIFFQYVCLIIIVFNYIDFLMYSGSIISYLLIKLLILCLIFFITFFLFNLNIIGGADAKLTITLFLMIPLNFFRFFLIFKYTFWFLTFQALITVSNFFTNIFFKNKFSFNQFFITNEKKSKLEKTYFNMFYTFSNYSEFNFLNNSKFLIKDINLYFNFKSERFQILTQARSPLIVIIIITYYFLFLI